MKLHELKYTEGARHKSWRVGRGPGTGNGKTAGKGQKGQNSRSGGGVRPGFEGGQTPLYNRIPKFGFNNINRKEYAIVNLSQLEKFDNGAEVTVETLIEKGIIKNELNGVKILGRGELTKTLTVKAKKFSASAQAAIEKVGGKAEIV